jgi:eukaryotic-like serine/threonine-protein kinase
MRDIADAQFDDLAVDWGAGSQVSSVGAVSLRRWVLGLGALLPVLLAIWYLGWKMWRSPVVATPLRAVPLASLPGVTRSPSFSPDGNYVAFSWTGPDGNNPDIYVQQIGAGAPLRLTTSPGSDYSPMWSPDGRWIAFLRGEGEGGRPHDLRLVPPLTGPERKVTEIRPRGFLRALTVEWCTDSSCVVVIDSLGVNKPDALFVVSLESGEKRQLTHPQDSTYADNDPAISPDGKWLAFRRDVAPFAGGLYLLPLRNDVTAVSEPRRLTPTSLYAYNPRWMPDSTEIVFSARGALWRLSIADESSPERLPFVGEDGVTPVVSRAQRDRSARLAYVRSYTDANIWRIGVSSPGEPASSPPTVAISSTRRDANADIAADGGQVTFTSTRSGESEIWRADPSGTGAVQLTSMSTIPGFPRWSPNGKLIVFHTNGVDGNGDIFIMPAQGGKPRNLTSHPAIDVFPSFSQDGQWIYFTSYRTGQPTIWKIAVSGGHPIQVSTDWGMMPIESPDGTYLYYVESVNLNRPGTLWRVPVRGGAAVKIIEGVSASTFDIVDSGIYFVDSIRSETRLEYFDLATSRVTTVARNLGTLDGSLSASRDGRTILFSRVDSSVNDLMLVEHFR